ncbi:MAG: class I SAM-dependent methyltransferase [Elusimicrobia bacterium]|nr:class I SAM-dependent methyltransferase [Elusimicrobiota bacterium]
MTDQDVKAYMRERYDAFADRVANEVRSADRARLWATAEGVRPALAYYRRRKVETALRLGGFRTGAAVLDVGCATGDYTFLFARKGFRMTGVDLSPRSIETARAKAAVLGLPDIDFIHSDAETLAELPTAAFDGVVSFSALRYVPRLDAALGSIKRVLRPGGVATLDFPNRHSPWFTLLKWPFAVERHPYDNLYTADEIAERLDAAGFREIRTVRILFTSYLTPAPILPFFKIADRLGEPLPFLGRFAAIIVARGIAA